MIANLNHIDKLVFIAKTFSDETNWGWTFSEKNTVQSFYTAITHPDMDVIIIEKHGVPLAAAIVSIESDFYEEKIGDIIEFYVMPEARGTGVARELLKEVCDWFDGHDAKKVFVKATANIGKDKAFINLFKKYGFNVFSFVLVR